MKKPKYPFLPGWYRWLLDEYERRSVNSHDIFPPLALGVLKLFTALWGRVKGVSFPKRAIGGDWWIYRYRFNFLMGYLEPESVYWVRQLVKPGMTVVDAGAHIGYYTRLLVELTGDKGKVFAFEPSPENFPVLQHNLRRSSGGFVQLSNYAVSDNCSPAKLHISPGHSNHSLLEGFREEQGVVEVTCVSLDAFFAKQEIDRIDFIKIDVEGAEPLVIKGMENILKASPTAVMLVEYNPQALRLGIGDPAGLISRIEEMGFQVKAILPDGTLDGVPRDEDTINILCRKQWE